MELLPVVLLLLALFVAARLVQMAVDPSARQNGPARPSGRRRARAARAG